MRHIIIYGNPIDGYKIWGPFPDRDSAMDFGEARADGDWWVTELITPQY